MFTEDGILNKETKIEGENKVWDSKKGAKLLYKHSNYFVSECQKILNLIVEVCERFASLKGKKNQF